MSAPLTWRVIGVTADDHGMTVGFLDKGFHANCGHCHETQAEAEACPWEPEAPPWLYAGLVAQVRDDRFDPRMRREQGRLL